jgi:predicted nucleotidyltransferase component of viral defense system
VSKTDSIKAKLKNQAIKERRTFQEILTVYALERALYRLSISPYANNFILKGGILLYALYDGDFARGTADVDLLGQDINNDLEVFQQTFHDIFTIPYPDDAIVYDLESLRVTRILEFKQYPGIHVRINGYLSRTKIPVQIDVGFGDVVYPEGQTMAYPTLLDQPPANLHVYSKESVIAEKFEAIVSLGNATSRMKDFYDIYALSNSYSFFSRTLSEALQETFRNRKTTFDTIVAFEEGFRENQYRNRVWNSFLKTKHITQPLHFYDVLSELEHFLLPIVLMIKEENVHEKRWNPMEKIWQ